MPFVSVSAGFAERVMMPLTLCAVVGMAAAFFGAFVFLGVWLPIGLWLVYTAS